MAMLVTISKKFSPSWTTHFTPSWTINAIPLWIRIFLHEPTNKKMLRRQDSTLFKKKNVYAWWNDNETFLELRKPIDFFLYFNEHNPLIYEEWTGTQNKKTIATIETVIWSNSVRYILFLENNTLWKMPLIKCPRGFSSSWQYILKLRGPNWRKHALDFHRNVFS